ncbi:MAG TPA: hypothetical protein VI142_04870 [Gaiellaceae bacterium]
MTILGAIVGILVGFAVGVFFTEWVFANNQSWTDVVPFALAVLGGLVGHELGRRFSVNRTGRTHSA